MMLFKTADWDDSTLTHNALATETTFLSYRLVHEFNRPARATVVLSDPDGSTAQKYDVDAAGDSVYVGPGRAYIEDPTATAIFDGRIVRAISDMDNHRLVLECEDWLSQLDDDKITYDMREDLDPLDAASVQGLRQSETATDPNNAKDYLRRPVVRTLYSAQAKDGAVYTDETAEANEDTADDMTLLPAVPAVGDAYYFGSESQVTSVIVNVSQAGDYTGTMIWQYWDGGAWSSLSGVTDGTNRFKTAGTNTVSWTLPGDWATVAVNGVTCYWVRCYTTVATAPGVSQALGGFAYSEYWLYDDDMSWTADDYNGMYLVLGGGMAGSQTIGSGPWQITATEYNDGLDTGGTWANSFTTWYYDGIYDIAVDNDSNYELDYDYSFPFINSSLLQSGSISEIRLKTALYFGATDSTAKLQIDDKTDGWIDLEELNPDAVVRYYELIVPPNKLADVFDSDGNLTIRVDVDWTSGTATVQIDYLWIEIDCITTGYSSAISITDTQTNRLLVGTDLLATANRIWEGCPYSIVRPIYKHIDSGESPGTLITAGDVLYTLTCAATIEHTSGLSLRHYHERSRLEILKDLAAQDNSVFWVTLGGTTVTWKSTFNDGAPTAMTDASVLKWISGDWNYKSMFNEFHIYGATIGDHQLTADTSDATSKATYGIARTGVVTQSGVFSQYDCTQLASKLVTRNKDVNLYLEAELGGLSALRLGDEVSITSSYLGLTAEKYTVTHWAFDSPSYRTTIRLHPRASTTGYQENIAITEWRRSIEGQRELQSDLYVPDLTTQEWS